MCDICRIHNYVSVYSHFEAQVLSATTVPTCSAATLFLEACHSNGELGLRGQYRRNFKYAPSLIGNNI